MDLKKATRKRLEERGINIEGLIALLQEQPKEKKMKPARLNEEQSDLALENKVKNIMYQLNGPVYLKGYQYTADAIIMAVKDKSVIENMTKRIYSGVAKMHNTTYSCVERNIRHWIEIAWSRSTEEEQKEFFGATVNPLKGKPTNSEFIATIANYIRMGGE